MKKEKPSTSQHNQRKRISDLMEMLRAPKSDREFKDALAALGAEHEDLLEFKEANEPWALGQELENNRIIKQLQADNNKLLADNIMLEGRAHGSQQTQQSKTVEPQNKITKLQQHRPQSLALTQQIRASWEGAKRAVVQRAHNVFTTKRSLPQESFKPYQVATGQTRPSVFHSKAMAVTILAGGSVAISAAIIATSYYLSGQRTPERPNMIVQAGNMRYETQTLSPSRYAAFVTETPRTNRDGSLKSSMLDARLPSLVYNPAP